MEAKRVLDALLEPAVIVHRDGQLIAGNEAWRSSPMHADHGQVDVVFGEHHTLLQGIYDVLEGQRPNYTETIVCPLDDHADDRQYYHVQITPYLQEKDHIMGALIVLINVTAQKRREAELEQLAFFDHLTGMYNRRKMQIVFAEAFSIAASQGHRLAVVLFDLDNFKWINDSHGHDVGDMALQKFAQRLLTFRSDNVVMGRLGWDEFFVVMKQVDSDQQVREIIHQVRDSLLSPLHIADLDLRIKIDVSAGYAIYPEDGTTMGSLYRYADMSLYTEKPKFAGRT